ncbi:helix-turn-helix transcriptional regulator [Aliidiomarina halalkaliphila]|uniref:Helix-turn-helix transcriptional regulator n=1 Tax=Aliidiomarina halalkaliphila TaxID=2593535 RepID=A0A552X157_9GAMM|nr:helix-turn-helix transcriptional regulator [Aliidiomarina halalkaliphila]TRW48676.1 helix-turn-helix transcriptional regulator [Aliidiomarina halalkaliphila]
MEIQATVVRETRVSKGWTQQQLSDVSGLSLRTVQRVESQGQGSLETCNALCAVLEIPRESLLQREANESDDGKGILMPIVVMSVLIGFVAGIMVTLAFR